MSERRQVRGVTGEVREVGSDLEAEARAYGCHLSPVLLDEGSPFHDISSEADSVAVERVEAAVAVVVVEDDEEEQERKRHECHGPAELQLVRAQGDASRPIGAGVRCRKVSISCVGRTQWDDLAADDTKENVEEVGQPEHWASECASENRAAVPQKETRHARPIGHLLSIVVYRHDGGEQAA